MRADGTIGTQQRPGRLRVSAGLGLVAAAGIVAWTATSGTDPTTQAWVAREPVPAQGPVAGSEFQLAEVSLPDPGVLWPAGSVPQGEAVRTLAAGEPLLASDVRPRASGTRRVALPVAAEQLPAGLAPGDVVDVWSPGNTQPLLSGVVVQDVAPPDIGPGHVEVAVPTAAVRAAVTAAATEQLVLARH